jgi:hypothetical protein
MRIASARELSWPKKEALNPKLSPTPPDRPHAPRPTSPHHHRTARSASARSAAPTPAGAGGAGSNVVRLFVPGTRVDCSPRAHSAASGASDGATRPGSASARRHATRRQAPPLVMAGTIEAVVGGRSEREEARAAGEARKPPPTPRAAFLQESLHDTPYDLLASA